MDFSKLHADTGVGVRVFEQAWQQLLCCYDPSSDPLHEAVLYALGNNGKQIRPLFCLLSAHACGADMKQALLPALAVEMIHTYSLIHDDLPCMDDDHLRRGKPTLHIKYDEATAVLVGDALLTDAFCLVASDEFCPGLVWQQNNDRQRLRMVELLGRAAGSWGMVRGQALDLLASQDDEGTTTDLERLHLLKTGELLGAACACGAIAAAAEPQVVEQFRQFGRWVGLAFQIVDDLLDGYEGTGKSRGKDQNQHKLTFASALSELEAYDFAQDINNRALTCLEGLGPRSEPLLQLADGLLARRY